MNGRAPDQHHVHPLKRIICIAENRPEEQVAVKLLLLSLRSYCPDVPVYLSYQGASPNFTNWLQRIPFVAFQTPNTLGNLGWNIKPHLLLDLLKQGYEEVWWLDTDILITCDFINKYVDVNPEDLIISEEAMYGSHSDNGLRTTLWGLSLGNPLPFSLNTSVMRVTPNHIHLVERWCELLENETYRKAQNKDWKERPKHMLGDQDVLTALVGSKEFQTITLKPLYIGKDIIQYFGLSAYTTKSRLINLKKGIPSFIHCQRWKPWALQASLGDETGLRKYIMGLYIELSPYRQLALPYSDQLEEQCNWLTHSSFPAKIFIILGCNNPALTGLPLQMFIDLLYLIRKL